MPVTYRQLAVSFSTADAERPVIEYRDGRLTLQFVDWREQPVTVHFPNVVAFHWQDEANLPPGVRDDMTYELLDSPWVAELEELGAIFGEHHHYKICFNACGVLDVVSGALPAPA